MSDEDKYNRFLEKIERKEHRSKKKDDKVKKEKASKKKAKKWSDK